MKNPHTKIASLLRTEEKNILNLEEKMCEVTGRKNIIEKVAEENDILVKKTLGEFGLDQNSSSEDVYHALIERLIFLDKQLYEILRHPNLFEEKGARTLIQKGVEITNNKKGLFLKEEKAREMLINTPPPNILKIFGYKDIEDLFAKESLVEIYSALRILEDMDWMNNVFIENYSNLTIDDFEERNIEVIVLGNKWIEAADKFLKKKYHNLSHLKELGIIFIVPVKIDTQGETTRLFSLLLHYLNEIPFYSSLFRKFADDADFSKKLITLLKSDVLEGPLPPSDKVQWRIIQRYLAKDDAYDLRLFEWHVSPEAEHWYKAEEVLARVDGEKQFKSGEAFGYWRGMDFVGDIFMSANDRENIVSFDLIDLVMSLVKKGDIKYLYHQQESLWNKIFIEYFSREEMNQLIEENIIKGYIEL